MYNLTTLPEVEHFVMHVINDLDVNFHPDTNFGNYVNVLGLPSFDEQTAIDLNATLAQAFAVCEASGTDIYEVSLPLLQARILA